jgi:protein TonB
MAKPGRATRSPPLRTAAFLSSAALHAGLFVAASGVGLTIAVRASDRGNDRVLVLSVATGAPAAALDAAASPPRADPRGAPTPDFAPFEAESAPELETLTAEPLDVDALAALPDAPAESSDVGPIPLLPGPSRPHSATGPIGSRPLPSSLHERAAASATNAAATPATSPIDTPAAPAAGSHERSEAPATTRTRAPDYPRRALDLHLEGDVVLLVHVGADGRVERAEVETSSRFALLDDAALAAVLEWEFKPRQVDGRATPFLARVPFHFFIPDETKKAD